MVAEAGGNVFRLKQAIKKAEKRLGDSYGAMGIRAYGLIQDGEIDQQDLNVVYGEINSILEEIQEYKAAIKEIQEHRAAQRGKKCPNCGGMASAGARFCPGCGINIEQATAPVPAGGMRKCPYCDGVISADAVFCGHCGAKSPPDEETKAPEFLGTQPTSASTPPETSAQPPPPPETTATTIAPEPSDVPQSPTTSPNPIVPGSKTPSETSQIPTPVVQLQQTMHARRCPHCGDEVSIDARFCLSCGKALS